MTTSPDPDMPAHRPIRVLHVLEATLGGTLRYLENIADATEGSGVESAFAYGQARADSRLEPFLDRIAALGWETYAVDMHREINLRRDVRALGQLRHAIRKFSPDVVHCHSSKAGALGRAASVHQRNSPVRLYSPHALAAPLGSNYLRIEKLLSHFTESFIAVSESEQDEIVGFSLADQQAVSVVYPSVDTEFFSPSSRDEARARLGLGSAPLVISIGRLTVQKNPAGFIEVVRRLHTSRPDMTAIWVGSGTGELDFPALVKAAGMDHVIRLATWQHDVRDYIAAADVFLSTSQFESFGYVTAEALCMCRPVVASDVTGTRDIMRGELREWLYSPADLDQAVSSTLRLLDSPALALAVGATGRIEVQKRFSKSRMRDSLLEAYARNLPNANGARGWLKRPIGPQAPA